MDKKKNNTKINSKKVINISITWSVSRSILYFLIFLILLIYFWLKIKYPSVNFKITDLGLIEKVLKINLQNSNY